MNIHTVVKYKEHSPDVNVNFIAVHAVRMHSPKPLKDNDTGSISYNYLSQATYQLPIEMMSMQMCIEEQLNGGQDNLESTAKQRKKADIDCSSQHFKGGMCYKVQMTVMDALASARHDVHMEGKRPHLPGNCGVVWPDHNQIWAYVDSLWLNVDTFLYQRHVLAKNVTTHWILLGRVCLEREDAIAGAEPHSL